MTFKTQKRKNFVLAVVTAVVCIAVTAFCYLNSNIDLSLLFRNGPDTDFVKFIDVGQGDSILIHSGGYTALIDTGPAEGANYLSKTLKECGIKKIDVLILTHLHLDHTGGVTRLFNDFSVDNLVLPELSSFSEGIHSAQFAINEISHKGGEIYSAVQGMNFELGNFELTVLAVYRTPLDENDRSIVIMAENLGKRFLFTGDIESIAEEKLLKEKIKLKCDVLKVAHHGSNTSSTEEFLRAAAPDYAVISLGANNLFGHPHKKVLYRLEKLKAEIFRTDKSGNITFTIKKGELTVNTTR